MQPDALIIQDPTLLHQVDVFAGLAPGGYILINTDAQLRRARPRRIRRWHRVRTARTVPATEIALQHVGRPLPNAALLGGFAALTGQISLDVGGGRDPRKILRPGRRGQRRRGARGLRRVSRQLQGDRPC